MSRVGALIAPFLAVDMASRSAAAAHGAEGIIAGCCLAAAVATAALPMETSGRQLTVRDDESTQLLIGMVCLKCHARARVWRWQCQDADCRVVPRPSRVACWVPAGR